MSEFLLILGIMCIAASIVGGGLKAFGIEIPSISSKIRQIFLLLFGIVLVFLSGSVGQTTSNQVANSKPNNQIVKPSPTNTHSDNQTSQNPASVTEPNVTNDAQECAKSGGKFIADADGSGQTYCTYSITEEAHEIDIPANQYTK